MNERIYDSSYMDTELGFAYRFLDQKNIATFAHTHNYYEYFLVTQGRVRHLVNGREEILNRGSLVLIRPDDCHYYEPYNNETLSITNISFTVQHFYAVCNFLGDDIEHLISTPLHPPTINILPFSDCSLEEDHNFLKFFVGDNQELKKRMRFLLAEVLLTFFRYTRLQKEEISDVWLQRVLSQMSSPENIEEGVPALLRIAKISHGHLCRLMRQQLHTTPNQYITKLRMIYAANLLSNSDETILDISLKCGYSSLSHFITTFKSRYGIPPHTYRSMHSGDGNWK